MRHFQIAVVGKIPGFFFNKTKFISTCIQVEGKHPTILDIINIVESIEPKIKNVVILSCIEKSKKDVDEYNIED